MCGRYVLKSLPSEMVQAFELQEENLPVVRYGRFNIAPSQSVVVLRRADESKKVELVTMRWGLIPSWSKELTGGLINARAETISEKPSFKKSFKERRCLVLADGFYEWLSIEGRKQPYYFSLKDGRTFGFAGIFDRYSTPEGETIESCAIITTAANEVVGKVHARMPVILSEPDEWRTWLEFGQKPEILTAMLKPLSDEKTNGWMVSSEVNNPRNDSAELIGVVGG